MPLLNRSHPTPRARRLRPPTSPSRSASVLHRSRKPAFAGLAPAAPPHRENAAGPAQNARNQRERIFERDSAHPYIEKRTPSPDVPARCSGIFCSIRWSGCTSTHPRKPAPYPPRWEWPPAVAPAIARDTVSRTCSETHTTRSHCATMHGAAPAASRPRESARRYSDNPARECCASTEIRADTTKPAWQSAHQPVVREIPALCTTIRFQTVERATGTRPYPQHRQNASPCGIKTMHLRPRRLIKFRVRRESEYTRSVRGEPLPDGALAT